MSEGLRERTLVLRMDVASGDPLGQLLSYLATFAGGAGGLELLRRWLDNRKRKREEPIELTAKILDDGDELRRLLMEEVARSRADCREVLERAHQAEMVATIAKGEVERLRLRLERKDEELKGARLLIDTLRQAPPAGATA